MISHFGPSTPSGRRRLQHWLSGFVVLLGQLACSFAYAQTATETREKSTAKITKAENADDAPKLGHDWVRVQYDDMRLRKTARSKSLLKSTSSARCISETSPTIAS